MNKLLYHHAPIMANVSIDPDHMFQGYFDGCTKNNPGSSGAGYLIKNDEHFLIEGAYPLGTRTNNQA